MIIITPTNKYYKMASISSLWQKSNQVLEDKFNEGLSGINVQANEYFSSFNTIFTSIFQQEIDTQFKVPKICVVGEQSSGKSSLLENITKTPIFPSNKSMCTKQPIHLSLKNSVSETYLFNGQSIKKEDIRKTIESQFSKNDTISEETISVSISDSDLINFEFIDLPGIVSWPYDLKEKTERLADTYIKDNNMILCVIPATVTHLASYAPIALIQQNKMEKNTILVFTMPDKIREDDIGEQLISRILNEKDELHISDYLACSVIINRSHNSTSLAQNDTFSDEWFNDNVLSRIPDEHSRKIEIVNMLGVSKLIGNLNLYYRTFIDNQWIPSTQQLLRDDIENYKVELECIGIHPSMINKSLFTTYYTENVIPTFIRFIQDMEYTFRYSDFNNFKLYYEHIIAEISAFKWPHIDMRKPLSKVTSQLAAKNSGKLYKPLENSSCQYDICEVISEPPTLSNITLTVSDMPMQREGLYTAGGSESCNASPARRQRKKKVTEQQATGGWDRFGWTGQRGGSDSDAPMRIAAEKAQGSGSADYYSNLFESLNESDDSGYSNSQLNLHRFSVINNNIISKLTEIYIEKMLYFVNMSKSSVMLDICKSINNDMVGGMVFDFNTLHALCVHELFHKDYSTYSFFEVIEESEDYINKRAELNENIAKCSTAINKLTSLKNNTYFTINEITQDEVDSLHPTVNNSWATVRNLLGGTNY